MLAARNGLNGQTLRKQYKEKISGYCEWDLLEHAEDYLLFPENFGTDMSLDETCLSNGDAYTVLTNKAAHGGKGTPAAMIRGVATDTVSAILDESPPQGAPQGKDGDDGPVLGHDADSQERVRKGDAHQRPLPCPAAGDRRHRPDEDSLPVAGARRGEQGYQETPREAESRPHEDGERPGRRVGAGKDGELRNQAAGHGAKPPYHAHAQVQVEPTAEGKGRHPLLDVPEVGEGIRHLS